MSDTSDAPWQGDACGLVEAFRRGDRSPAEELSAVYAAIDGSDLNAFSHLHREQAEAARQDQRAAHVPANLHGNPAISVPAGFVDGLPVGLQIVGPHFSEELLLDLALTVERELPWPLTVHDSRAEGVRCRSSHVRGDE